jgi:LPS sulfotransferase NodH
MSEFSAGETLGQRGRRRLARAYRRIAQPGLRPRPFLVLTTSRSGSTWTCDLLARVLSCGNVAEHLRPEHLQAVQQGDAAPGTLVDYCLAVLRDMKRGHIGGSKLIWDDMPPVLDALPQDDIERLCTALRGLQPVMIRLRRDDLPAQAISRHRAQQSGRYHRFRVSPWRRFVRPPRLSPADAIQTTAQPYDLNALIAHRDLLQRAESHLDATLARNALRTLDVSYERLIENPHAELAPVFHTLLGDRLPPAVWQRRLSAALRRSRLQRNRNADEDPWRAQFTRDLARHDGAI